MSDRAFKIFTSVLFGICAAWGVYLIWLTIQIVKYAILLWETFGA